MPKFLKKWLLLIKNKAVFEYQNPSRDRREKQFLAIFFRPKFFGMIARLASNKKSH
jgi:hypothetical protein